MDKTVAIIEKNRVEEIRVRLVEFHGRPFADIRVFTTADATGERVPTRKGIALRPEKLPELIEALRGAERRAWAAGLIEDDSPAPARGADILAAG